MASSQTPLARALAVLGTGSDVGKTLIATALGRLLSDAGFDVAPFKAQNMALQAGVTVEGGEMGRAQILQARACRLEPHVDMNPVLLKPRSETASEVIVLGRPYGTSEARAYFSGKNPLAEVAEDALLRLARRHRVLILEGAGSPVELNLMDRDFVNLRPARRLGAAIVLVADINKGGVFAQIKGTVDLLPAEDRRRLQGIVVNRFRGDMALFDDGVRLIESMAESPVLAVVPWMTHDLDEEDRPFKLPIDAAPVPGQLNVGVVLHPRVSNTEDLAPLLAEPDVAACWITGPNEIAGRDLLILPGTKSTVADAAHHSAMGMAEGLRQAAAAGAWLVGLCGGYQMLGQSLDDPELTDGPVTSWPGLGLLDVKTRFQAEKILAQPCFESIWPTEGLAVDGYEIHHGRTVGRGDPIVRGAGAEVGVRKNRVVGTYLHGLLARDEWRAAFLNEVRRSRGLPPQPLRRARPLDDRISRWAAHVRRALRPGAWDSLRATLERAAS